MVGLKVSGVVPRSVRVCLCQAVVRGTVLAPGKGVRSTFLLQAQLDPGALLLHSVSWGCLAVVLSWATLSPVIALGTCCQLSCLSQNSAKSLEVPESPRIVSTHSETAGLCRSCCSRFSGGAHCGVLGRLMSCGVGKVAFSCPVRR